MIEKNNFISIKFDLKPPEDAKDSITNTIVLLLRNIVDMQKNQKWNEYYVLELNETIEKVKRELDNLKIIVLEEDEQ